MPGSMAKKAATKKEEQKKEQRILPGMKAWLGRLYRRGIIGVLLISLSIVTFLGLIQDTSGFLVDWWSDLLLRMLGWASYAIVLVVAAVGGILMAGKVPEWARVQWHIVGGIEIMFLSLMGLMHIIYAGADPWQAAQAGEGGGYVGAVFGGVLSELLGSLGAGVVLSAVFLWGMITVSGLTFEEWVERFESCGYQVWQWLSVALTGLLSRRSAEEDGSVIASAVKEAYRGRSVSALQPTTASADASASTSKVASKSKRSHRYRITLPPIELLDSPADALFDESDIRRKARIIEETLSHFDVPAKVIETNWGPMVTQFGVEPGYVTRRGYNGEETERKIRVAKIASLSDDLALALAAAPIRIEAPVPGRSIVGIEVPNGQVSRVSLRRAMSSTAFRRRKSSLRLALGEGVAGTPIVADLSKMPHLLIAGATGSGKSVCINAIACCLLFQNSPLTLRLVMIDPKRVELSRYNGVPHLFGQVESDVERVVGVLHWLVHEMQERYKKFAQAGARHLDAYNRLWRVGSQEYLPRIVVLIDELADLMLFAPEDVERSICRLAQMARATGMHLAIATQRPSVDVVTGLIKANFPARIGFAVSSGVDSRVILDTIGAETLLSKGDMLYMAPDSSKLVRALGCFVSDAEVGRVVRYWQEWATAEEWEREPCPWETLLDQEDETKVDDVLRQAIEIVRQQGSASASLLQRRMHIGYPRASRLIDEMEKRGIVGPATSGGKTRQVLDLPGYEAEAMIGSGKP